LGPCCSKDDLLACADGELITAEEARERLAAKTIFSLAKPTDSPDCEHWEGIPCEISSPAFSLSGFMFLSLSFFLQLASSPDSD